MSIEFPILSNNFELVTSLGREFRNIQNDERNRGLLEPIIKSRQVNRSNISTDKILGIVQNKDTIFGNNFNSKEDLSQTNDEALNFIIDTLDSAKQLRAGQLISLNDDDNNNVDPRLRALRQAEANLDPNDLFDEFGNKATDFVNLVRKSNQEYLVERNLFAQPSTVLKDTLKSFGPSGSKSDGLVDQLIDGLGLAQSLSDERNRPLTKSEDLARQQAQEEASVQFQRDQNKTRQDEIDRINSEDLARRQKEKEEQERQDEINEIKRDRKERQDKRDKDKKEQQERLKPQIKRTTEEALRRPEQFGSIGGQFAPIVSEEQKKKNRDALTLKSVAAPFVEAGREASLIVGSINDKVRSILGETKAERRRRKTGEGRKPKEGL